LLVSLAARRGVIGAGGVVRSALRKGEQGGDARWSWRTRLPAARRGVDIVVNDDGSVSFVADEENELSALRFGLMEEYGRYSSISAPCAGAGGVFGRFIPRMGGVEGVGVLGSGVLVAEKLFGEPLSSILGSPAMAC
jgi:hypothetical protein